MDFQNDWNSAVISAAAADVHKFKDEKKRVFSFEIYNSRFFSHLVSTRFSAATRRDE